MLGIQKSLDCGVLKINFDSLKGLQLTWNFKGQISNCTYYNHLFIVGCQDQDIAEILIKNYYEKMKSGDTFALVNTGSEHPTAKWIEKCDFSRGLRFKRTSNQSQMFAAQYLLECYLKKAGNTQNLIVNVISNKIDMKNLLEKIKKLRQKKQLKFLFNLFGNYKQEIQVSIGINLFSLRQQQNIVPLANFLKWFYSDIVIKQAEISIECLNASISSQNSSQWQNFPFNKIKRYYYAITRNQIVDTLTFIPASKDLTRYDLLVSIRYKKLNGDIFQSEKVVKIDASNDKSSNRTRVPNQFAPQFFLKGISLNSDPYEKETAIWIQRGNEEQ